FVEVVAGPAHPHRRVGVEVDRGMLGVDRARLVGAEHVLRASTVIAESMLDLVGRTPLVRIAAAWVSGERATVWAKMEHLNPGGSVKDRICLAMIEDAEARGVVSPPGPIVEPTSGNTGIGLAWVCAVKGYRLILTMPESMSLERRQLLEAYGAELILTPAERTMEGAVARAEELCGKNKNYFMPQQFNNPANPEVHRRTTARELLAQLGERGCDAFVAGVGTGGTISGVGEVFREKYKSI